MTKNTAQNDPKAFMAVDKQRLVGLIKVEREKRNISQAQFAEMLGVSQGRVAHLESKQAFQKVSYDALFSALEALGFFYRILPFAKETKEPKKEGHLVIHGKLGNPIAGFSMENKEANSGGLLKVLIKGFFSSKDPDFHTIADNIAKVFLFPSIKGLMVSSVASLGHFVILFYKDGRFDVHLGMPTFIEGLSKKDIKAGEVVSYSDIVSVRRVKFPTITIPPDAGIIYHFSEGYRHGLFIDLMPLSDNPTEVDTLEKELAVYFQQLSYETHFKNDDIIAKMADDGWFRFAAIPKEMFDLFYGFYADSSIKDKASIVRNHFTTDRLSEMAQKWQTKPIIKRHKQFFDSAIESYKAGNYIGAISTFYPRIEGILRGFFENKENKPDLAWLLKKLREAGTSKAGAKSLLFPRQFQKYLENFLCKDFDFLSGKIDFSRHSHAHGVSNEEDYTRDRFIIGFLIIDQIFYYI